jgi:tetratricopeptide (TPR) repeat protein
LIGGLLVLVACQNNAGSGLPEPVSEGGPTGSVETPPANTGLPPNHPPITPQAINPGPAIARELPPGTRNPMEDIMAFKARLEKNPKDREALLGLANANMMISRFDAAQDLYARAVALDPKNLETRTNLAIAYAYGGQSEKALAAFRKNLEYDAKHDATMYNLGFLYYYDRKDPKAAADVWKRWLALYPNAPAAPEVSQHVARIDAERAAGPSLGARPSVGGYGP